MSFENITQTLIFYRIKLSFYKFYLELPERKLQSEGKYVISIFKEFFFIVQVLVILSNERHWRIPLDNILHQYLSTG